MNGLEKISERIRREGQAEADAIAAEAAKRVAAIRDFSREQAEQIGADAESKRRQAVAERLERLSGSADMERSQALLAAKQGCIDDAFAKAAEMLRKLPREEYIDLLAGLAVQNGAGDEEIVLSATDRESVGEAVAAAANAAKSGAAFTVSAETRELGGGLVLKHGLVETNCSFDTRLHRLRQEMASELAHILFD